MNSRKNACKRDEGWCSTRRDFSVRLGAILTTIACAPLPLGLGSSSDRGGWILNARDR